MGATLLYGVGSWELGVTRKFGKQKAEIGKFLFHFLQKITKKAKAVLQGVFTEGSKENEDFGFWITSPS
ncbi:MAG TPA: hypothetical protein VLK33_22890 [Terriglobales bacterium]|nr:hypothetical protein [Terriglobales bacterium]